MTNKEIFTISYRSSIARLVLAQICREMTTKDYFRILNIAITPIPKKQKVLHVNFILIKYGIIFA